jgi:hypothetical protein
MAMHPANLSLASRKAVGLKCARMNDAIVFVASGWPPEADFHSSIAKALAKRGISSEAVVLGPRYAASYKASGGFSRVHDLCDAMKEHWRKTADAGFSDAVAKAEKKYGTPSYWQYLAADRFLCTRSYEYNIKAAAAQTAFWESCFAAQKPRLLVGEISHFHNYLAWAVGQQAGVPFAHLIPARVPGHCAIGDGPFEHQNAVTTTYRAFQKSGIPEDLKKKAQDYIADFQGRTGRASHLQAVSAWHRSPVGTGTLDNFIADISRWYSEERQYNYTLVSPFEKLGVYVRQLYRKTAMTLQGVFCPPGQLPDREPFVLFGLHLQPESSTLVRGQFFQDMLAVARNLALSLPAGYRLFVKEHDVMFGRRPTSFYKDLKKIANVVLVSPYESGPALVRKAAAIAAVTGTFGWDAILLGKPAVVFGESFFAGYDGIRHCTDMTRLPTVLSELLSGYTLNEADRLCFVAAVMANTVPANMDDLWGLRNTDYSAQAEILADALIQRFRNH